MVLKNRLYVPYGPDLTLSPPQNGTNGEIWDGYGFGMGAVEHFAYDPVHRYVYAQSEFAPYVSIIDYSSVESNSGQPSITPFSLDLTSYDSDIRNIAVCNDYLMIVATDANLILQYTTVKRSSPIQLTLVREISAGNQPDNIRFNTDCTILAVANENDGSSTAVGTIHLVSNLNENEPTVRTVRIKIHIFS
jgi:6-phosphogluconolactonase (cycloisomerase 2 family)